MKPSQIENNTISVIKKYYDRRFITQFLLELD